MMPVVIREATEADIPALAHLHVKTWIATYPEVRSPPTFEIRERQWREAFATRDGSSSPADSSTETLKYTWHADGREHVTDFVYVRGTHGLRYPFGDRAPGRPTEVQDFFIGTVPVTQALWTHVMGADANPAVHRGMDYAADQLLRGRETPREGTRPTKKEDGALSL